jgi:IclR family pca regulon transcriptional regulator
VAAKSSEEPAAGKGPIPVQALSRGLGILSQFTAQDPALSLAELGRRTGLHRATVYRFVKTLQAEGFLTQDAAAGVYRVGPAWAAALYTLGSNSVLADILSSDLKMLATATGAGASISVRKGDHVQIINVVPVSSDNAPELPASSMVPLSEHAIVHARVHLAYSSEDTQRRMLAVPAVRHTERTVTDKAGLRTLLNKTASGGFAYSCGEYKKGLSAMAVPIFSKGDVVAALGLLIPSEQLTDDRIDSYARELRTAAALMGRRLDEYSCRLLP